MDLRCMNESERENDGKAVKFKPHGVEADWLKETGLV